MTNNKITRRKFIEVAGSTIIVASTPAYLKNLSTALNPKPYPGRKGNRIDLPLTRVGFGAQRTNDPDLIRFALDNGINHVETSWAYGFGRRGNNCECVGKAIKGKRDSIYLLVAYWIIKSASQQFSIQNQFEQSLKDLGTDYIDVFLWKQPEGLESITDEHNEYLQKLKSQGKVRWSGIIHHEKQDVYLQHVAFSRVHDVCVVAFNYKSPQEHIQAVKKAAKKGVVVIAMKTQSPNYLLGESLGDAPDHVKALEWVLSNKSISSAIPGMTTKAQVEMNVKLMNKIQKL
jgi:predicted aldo/keto reductase-like oxidoreductase